MSISSCHLFDPSFFNLGPGNNHFGQTYLGGRYNEWGRASLQRQKLSLQTPSSQVYYFSAFGAGQDKELAEMKSSVAAALMAARV